MKYNAAQLAQIESAIAAGQPTPAFPEPQKKRNDESRMQQALVRWWANVCGHYNLPEIALMAFPMQGARTEINAARMKNEGCRKGTLDMLLIVPAGAFHCLWIENKTETGRLRPEQAKMMVFLTEQYCQVKICRSLPEAQRVISGYLSAR